MFTADSRFLGKRQKLLAGDPGSLNNSGKASCGILKEGGRNKEKELKGLSHGWRG